MAPDDDNDFLPAMDASGDMCPVHIAWQSYQIDSQLFNQMNPRFDRITEEATNPGHARNPVYF